MIIGIKVYLSKHISPSDVSVHIIAVERAGLRELPDSLKVSFGIVEALGNGKLSGENLQLV
jgi:cold shock CspA family protein